MRDEAKEYRKAMEVLVDIQEALHRFDTTDVQAEISGPSVRLRGAVKDFETALVHLLRQQPPYATEIIHNVALDRKQWRVVPYTESKDTEDREGPEDEMPDDLVAPFNVVGPGTIVYQFEDERLAEVLCRRLNDSYDLGQDSRDLEVQKLFDQQGEESASLRSQVALLGNDLMSLDIGLPRIDEDHLNGMGICEAAAIGLKELKLERDSLTEQLARVIAERNRAVEMAMDRGLALERQKNAHPAITVVDWEPERDNNGDVLVVETRHPFHTIDLRLQDRSARPLRQWSSPCPALLLSHQFRIVQGPDVDPLKVSWVRLMEGKTVLLSLDYGESDLQPLPAGFSTDFHGKLLCDDPSRIIGVVIGSYVAKATEQPARDQTMAENFRACYGGQEEAPDAKPEAGGGSTDAGQDSGESNDSDPGGPDVSS